MPELTPDEVKQLMEQPQKVWAPDGTTFMIRCVLNDDARSVDQLFDMALQVQYEVRGPDGGDHLWLATWDGTLVPDPGHDDLPRAWTVKAELALDGWIGLINQLP